MNIQFPIFDVVLDEENGDIGLTAISLVDEPAIQRDFIFFSAEKSMIVMSDMAKREIVSPILIPNQLIYRVADDGTPYYMRWTEETIKYVAYKYIADGWFNNFTVMHPLMYNSELTYEDVLEKDVEMLRLWTIEEPETDEINAVYGFNLPKGTLCVHMHVGNDEIWQRIVSGELKGLSIEAYISLKINQKAINKKMEFTKENVSLFEKFLQFMNSVSDTAEALATQAKKDEAESGEITIKYWLDNEHYMQVDAEGFVRDEEMNLIASGKYMLADGSHIEVDENNKFVGCYPMAEEKETIEAPIAESEVKVEKVEVAQAEVKEEEVNEGEVEEKVAEPQDEAGDVDADADVQADRKDEPEVVETVEQANAEKKKLTIGEVEYDVDDAVAQRLAELEKQLEDAKSEMVKMSEVTPSVEPIQAPINQNSDNGRLTDAIRLLNLKR